MSRTERAGETPAGKSGRGVAIVGCGAISRAHAEAVASTEGWKLTAVVDSDRSALERAMKEFDVPGFDSVRTLLAGRVAETACVCTPPATHRQLSEELLHGGLDVLCEKPLAVSAGDARAVLDTARRAGRRLAVSDKFRHVTDLREAAERVHAGEIGTPVSYAVTFCAPVDVRGRWPSDPDLSGGGVVMDNGPHALDVLSHFLNGPIVDVEARLGQPVLAASVEDTANIVFRTQAGAIGRIELSWAYLAKDLDYLVVQGTEGTVCVGWSGGRLRRHGDGEWSSFGSGYDKRAAFRAMWRKLATVRGAEGWPDPASAVELIEAACSGALAANTP